MKNFKFPHLVYNWISSAGAIIASVTFVIILFLLLLDSFIGITNLYLGILIYLILPPILIFGLLLIPLGMYRQWRLIKKTGEVPVQRYPMIDFNKKSHRNGALIFIPGTAVFILMSAVGTYQAYHFSESVAFCGTTCHSVMEPEHTTYHNSPHARVSCTACHVGAGAGWYTKSKLSGAYQVYAVTVNNYPRPLPTPIENLRPARETCEQCHWPEKFFGAQQIKSDHYMYDEANTHYPVNMLFKTGGGDPKIRRVSGIHWHVSSGSKVEYIARDDKRQDIPWVRLTDETTGETVIYQDINEPLTAEEFAEAVPRVMDCMDCHNRPSHIFNSPDYAIDQAMFTGRISSVIPEIKRVAVEAMAEEYESKKQAFADIADNVTEYYKSQHENYYSQNSPLIDSAISAITRTFSQNIFPGMKARWSAYPNNIGHFYNKGCMRCHEGSHQSEDGLTITHDCNACHLILAQGSEEADIASISPEGFEFKHPVDIAEAWREIGCYDCHTGTQP
jgi:hypothetical protein